MSRGFLAALCVVGFCASSRATSSAAAQDLTLPAAPASVKVAVIGDSGTGLPAQYQVADQMARFHAKFKGFGWSSQDLVDSSITAIAEGDADVHKAEHGALTGSGRSSGAGLTQNEHRQGEVSEKCPSTRRLPVSSTAM